MADLKSANARNTFGRYDVKIELSLAPVLTATDIHKKNAAEGSYSERDALFSADSSLRLAETLGVTIGLRSYKPHPSLFATRPGGTQNVRLVGYRFWDARVWRGKVVTEDMNPVDSIWDCHEV